MVEVGQPPRPTQIHTQGHFSRLNCQKKPASGEYAGLQVGRVCGVRQPARDAFLALI
jgi:hypothetical protein